MSVPVDQRAWNASSCGSTRDQETNLAAIGLAFPPGTDGSTARMIGMRAVPGRAKYPTSKRNQGAGSFDYWWKDDEGLTWEK